MLKFLSGLVVGAIVMYTAMHFHLVRGQNGVFVVAKVTSDLSDVFVDIRGFTVEDWKQHKPLAAAIIQSDRSEVLDDATLDSFREGVHSVVDHLFSKD
ncbi:hypothetical protein [Allorhodopirellula heiligendammensis]|uniref:Uncharacterized protein n=1 Tax=Allorhodopirellula heiligendammensis TaxID=2714739 RepID=A0A5C6BHB0_9BACT|nr:hypothetical protein [Allorhodopirellula heiligendammensis]TWU11102.1 hypothetical protein Poly21_50090 [Allorhodopirellula heiligendammensis]